MRFPAAVRAALAIPPRRLSFAVAVSLMLHGLVLWLPKVELPSFEPEMQPLVAKLEPLPKTSAKLARPKPKPKAVPKPPVIPEPEVVATAEIPLAESAPVAASTPVAAEEIVAASTPVAAQELATASAPAETAPQAVASEATPPEPQRPPLPKRARLKFNIHKGQDGFKLGESIHELEVEDGRYTLKASVQTTGLASLLKSYRMVQTSIGSATQQTLRPESFSEEVTDSGGVRSHSAAFDWGTHTLRFSQGGEVTLPAQAQDILSILYQFPPMRQREEVVTINISTGKRFEKYNFEVVFEEPLGTPMGTLQTVHFRKQHPPGKEGLEIWFAQEYRLFPVKMRYIEPDGSIAAEAVITDIRVADE